MNTATLHHQLRKDSCDVENLSNSLRYLKPICSEF